MLNEPNDTERLRSRGSLRCALKSNRTMGADGGHSMAPTLLDGDTVLVDMTRRAPNPPWIFVLDDGMGLVAKRLEHIPNSDPPAVRVISDNRFYSPTNAAPKRSTSSAVSAGSRASSELIVFREIADIHRAFAHSPTLRGLERTLTHIGEHDGIGRWFE